MSGKVRLARAKSTLCFDDCVVGGAVDQAIKFGLIRHAQFEEPRGAFSVLIDEFRRVGERSVGLCDFA